MLLIIIWELKLINILKFAYKYVLSSLIFLDNAIKKNSTETPIC